MLGGSGISHLEGGACRLCGLILPVYKEARLQSESGSRVENGIKAALTDKNCKERISSAIRNVFLSRH